MKNISNYQKFLNNFKLLNKKLNLNLIRLNNTNTQQTTIKKYPHGIDLKNIKPNKSKKVYSNEFKEVNYSGAIILGAIPIITFGLGVWQIKRREWKLSMIKLLEERVHEKPIELPDKLNVLNDETYDYRPIKVTGHFDHSREILMTTKRDTTGISSLPGAYVITPFIVKDRNITILVNRGFVPYTNYLVETRKEAQIENDIELIGLLRRNEITNRFQPPNKPNLNEWHTRDIDLLALCLETEPIFLDATIESTIRNKRDEPIGPIGGQTVVNLRNEHLSYIITWFSLSALTSVMWFKNFGKYLFKFK